MFKKVLLVGVFTAVISLGLAGAGTASADDKHHHHNDCWIEATNSIDPACWNMVIWGGVANGWIPRAPFLFNVNHYYFFNYFPNYFYNPYYFTGQPVYSQHPHLNNPHYGDVKYGYWSNNLWWPYF
jgi:hypothetical protein